MASLTPAGSTPKPINVTAETPTPKPEVKLEQDKNGFLLQLNGKQLRVNTLIFGGENLLKAGSNITQDQLDKINDILQNTLGESASGQDEITSVKLQTQEDNSKYQLETKTKGAQEFKTEVFTKTKTPSGGTTWGKVQHLAQEVISNTDHPLAEHHETHPTQHEMDSPKPIPEALKEAEMEPAPPMTDEEKNDFAKDVQDDKEAEAPKETEMEALGASKAKKSVTWGISEEATYIKKSPPKELTRPTTQTPLPDTNSLVIAATKLDDSPVGNTKKGKLISDTIKANAKYGITFIPRLLGAAFGTVAALTRFSLRSITAFVAGVLTSPYNLGLAAYRKMSKEALPPTTYFETAVNLFKGNRKINYPFIRLDAERYGKGVNLGKVPISGKYLFMGTKQVRLRRLESPESDAKLLAKSVGLLSTKLGDIIYKAANQLSKPEIPPDEGTEMTTLATEEKTLDDALAAFQKPEEGMRADVSEEQAAEMFEDFFPKSARNGISTDTERFDEDSSELIDPDMRPLINPKDE